MDDEGDRMAESRSQRLITKLVPRSWAASMETESRAWMVRCRSCGFERSIWELGGIRWKATGSKLTWGRCPHCGKRGWHTIYRRDQTEPLTGLML
jgi:DNA-directed RNA polymerase subunit RPC12/RpoP